MVAGAQPHGSTALTSVDSQKLVEELAKAVSTQANFANRTWLALMTVALFGTLPRLPGNQSNVSLPFNLGEVAPVWFHSVVFCILVVLTIAFAGAHMQQIRAYKLAHALIDSLVARPRSLDEVHPREMFDMLRLPSFIRVAPLAQSLKGKYQFFAAKKACPPWRIVVSQVYYALLKMVALAVYFGLPGWALWRAYVEASSATGFHVIFAVVGCLAGATLIQVAEADIWNAASISRAESRPA